MRNIRSAIVIVGLGCPALLPAQNPAIQQVVDAVNVDFMEWHWDTCEYRVPAFSASDPVLPLASGSATTHTCSPP